MKKMMRTRINIENGEDERICMIWDDAELRVVGKDEKSCLLWRNNDEGRGSG